MERKEEIIQSQKELKVENFILAQKVKCLQKTFAVYCIVQKRLYIDLAKIGATLNQVFRFKNEKQHYISKPLINHFELLFSNYYFRIIIIHLIKRFVLLFWYDKLVESSEHITSLKYTTVFVY